MTTIEKRQFEKKDWLSIWWDQLFPFLMYLKESQTITHETSNQIRRSLMMNANELKKYHMENKKTVNNWIPEYISWVKNFVYTKDELLCKMKEQNYFRDWDKIINIDELREAYVNFVKNRKLEMKNHLVKAILQDLYEAKRIKASLQTALETFVKKINEEQAKCDDNTNSLKKELQTALEIFTKQINEEQKKYDDKIWLLKKELQKKWYKGDI